MTHVLVPQEPTETMWSGLARDLVMWCRFDRPTGSALYTQLKMLGKEIPDWLAREIPNTDTVPPKGTVAACIYKAMLATAPEPDDAGELERLKAEVERLKGGWRDIASCSTSDNVPVDLKLPDGTVTQGYFHSRLRRWRKRSNPFPLECESSVANPATGKKPVIKGSSIIESDFVDGMYPVYWRPLDNEGSYKDDAVKALVEAANSAPHHDECDLFVLGTECSCYKRRIDAALRPFLKEGE